MGLDLRSGLRKISVPTLVLHATGDRHHPVEHGRHLAEHNPNARYTELESNSHLPVVPGDCVLVAAV